MCCFVYAGGRPAPALRGLKMPPAAGSPLEVAHPGAFDPALFTAAAGGSPGKITVPSAGALEDAAAPIDTTERTSSSDESDMLRDKGAGGD